VISPEKPERIETTLMATCGRRLGKRYDCFCPDNGTDFTLHHLVQVNDMDHFAGKKLVTSTQLNETIAGDKNIAGVKK